MKNRLLILAAMLVALTVPHTVVAQNQDTFSAVSPSGHLLYYYKDTEWGSEVILTYQHYPNGGEVVPAYENLVGDLEIPDTVEYNGTTYSVTGICQWAFAYCTRLTSVTIPNSVTNIGQFAFSNCSSLMSVIIPHSVTTIESGVFWGCTSLTSITISEGVIYIEESAFEECTSLMSVTIPESVTYIGRSAFYGCCGLEKVIIGSAITYIGNNAFAGWDIDSGTGIWYGGSCQDNIIDSIIIMAEIPPYMGENCFGSSNVYVPCGLYQDYQNACTSNPEFYTSVCFTWHFCELLDGIHFRVEKEESAMARVEIVESHCSDNKVVIRAINENGYVFDHWSNGRTDNPYTLYLTGDSTITAYFTFVGEVVRPSICMVNVYENTNVVIWDKDPTVYQYNIYREGGISGEYELMGTVSGDEQSVWYDGSSRPMNRSYRYRITTSNIYGQESEPSEEHKTMHLTINKGQGKAWNLIWTEYEGADFVSYLFYRGTSWSGLELIDQIPVGGNTTYTDYDAPDDYVYYRVDVLKATPCNISKSHPYIRSNIATNGPVGIDDVDTDDIVVYAYNGRIEVSGSEGETVYVYDMMGREVAVSAIASGGASVQVPVSGVYMVKIGNAPARKVVVIR